MDKSNDIEIEKNEEWDFEDYAFTIATVLFAAFMIFGIVLAAIDIDPMNISAWWPFSWILFMFAWSACLVKDVIDIKRGTQNIDGNLEDAAETALYVGITTIMLLVGIVRRDFYSSWLAGPITFVLLAAVWPILRNPRDAKLAYIPIIPLIILMAGIIAEVVIGGWVAFPVSWILICAVKVYKLIRKYKPTENMMLDIMYYTFTIIFISISLFRELWVISWLGYPLAVIISKVVGKIKGKAA